MQIWTSFLHSGWTGKLVLFLLLAFSLASWTVMFVLALRLSSASSASARFRKVFRSANTLADVQTGATGTSHSPLVGLFKAGFAEIDSQMRLGGGSQSGKLTSLAAVERSLLRASRVETVRLTRNLALLATTASATPFIGLFGTVWGIMDAFRNIGVTGSASIVAVAPGISEALINTAAGLFAAIPALVAYNYFSARIRSQRADMEDFGLEFLNLTERLFG